MVKPMEITSELQTVMAALKFLPDLALYCNGVTKYQDDGI